MRYAAEGQITMSWNHSSSGRDGLTSVSITINDASGRVLTVIKVDYAAGYNTVNVTKQMIQGATGVLSYTIEAGDYTATKQMVVE